MKKTTFFTDAANRDVILHLMKYLDAQDLLALASCNHLLFNLSQETYLPIYILQQEFKKLTIDLATVIEANQVLGLKLSKDVPLVFKIFQGALAATTAAVDTGSILFFKYWFTEPELFQSWGHAAITTAFIGASLLPIMVGTYAIKTWIPLCAYGSYKLRYNKLIESVANSRWKHLGNSDVACQEALDMLGVEIEKAKADPGYWDKLISQYQQLNSNEQILVGFWQERSQARIKSAPEIIIESLATSNSGYVTLS
jgi:hypothetical protein